MTTTYTADNWAELPVLDFKSQILDAVDASQVTIITAETGAGKSTQIPQYLAEHGYDRVVVTQPRILAARNLCGRVREEWALRNSEDSSETVGYRTFFAGGNFTSSAEALGACRICFIEKSVLEYLLDRNKDVMRDFTRQLANELKRSEEDMLYRSTLPARARLAHLLLNLVAHADIELKRKDLVWELPLSRQDMAAILGIRPETIARTLHSFEEEGVAHFEGRQVRVPQLDMLEAEAEEI